MPETLYWTGKAWIKINYTDRHDYITQLEDLGLSKERQGTLQYDLPERITVDTLKHRDFDLVEYLKNKRHFSDQQIIDFFVFFEEHRDTAKHIVYLLPENLPIDHIFNSVRLNLLYKKIPEFLIGLNIKGFSFEIADYYSKERHGELPLQINIIYDNNENRVWKRSKNDYYEKPINPIGTIGFYLISTPNGIQFRFNGVQGSNNPHAKMLLEKLSRELGQNWRVWFLKKIINYSKLRGFKIIGELPERFIITDNIRDMPDPESNLSRYERGKYTQILRQYLQTYHKAGIPKEDLDHSKVWKSEQARVKQMVDNKYSKRKPLPKRPM